MEEKRKAGWSIDLKAVGEGCLKNLQSLVRRDYFFYCSPYEVHGRVLDSTHLGQQRNIKINFLLLSENKIPNYPIIKGFQLNASFWRHPVFCIISSRMHSRFPREPYFLLVLVPYLFLPCPVSFSTAVLKYIFVSNLLLEDACSPACFCNQEGCLTGKMFG